MLMGWVDLFALTVPMLAALTLIKQSVLLQPTPLLKAPELVRKPREVRWVSSCLFPCKSVPWRRVLAMRKVRWWIFGFLNLNKWLHPACMRPHVLFSAMSVIFHFCLRSRGRSAVNKISFVYNMISHITLVRMPFLQLSM